MKILVCYDVNTESREGRRRLRRVAKACEGRGQRVQKSVFECQLDQAGFESLERRLLDIIDLTQDNLRLYRLADGAAAQVREHGHFRAIDFDAPLVL
ncbi:MAG: CRISPR-associated endonuclease Cas2 [Rubrivivax sp.]